MPNEQTAKLSREQVQSVLNFAESLYIAEKYGSGYFSPWMSNQLMNNLKVKCQNICIRFQRPSENHVPTLHKFCVILQS